MINNLYMIKKSIQVQITTYIKFIYLSFYIILL